MIFSLTNIVSTHNNGRQEAQWVVYAKRIANTKFLWSAMNFTNFHLSQLWIKICTQKFSAVSINCSKYLPTLQACCLDFLRRKKGGLNAALLSDVRLIQDINSTVWYVTICFKGNSLVEKWVGGFICDLAISWKVPQNSLTLTIDLDWCTTHSTVDPFLLFTFDIVRYLVRWSMGK